MNLKKNSWLVWGLSVAVFSALVLSGGVGMSFAQSSRSCDTYARNYADNNSGSTAGGVLGGAAAGAAGGALLGGIIGGGSGAGKGAAIGAGVGAVTGGAQQSNAWSGNYDYAYRSCMRGD